MKQSRSGFDLWRDRNFALLAGGGVISFVGTQAQDIAIPLLLLSVTGSPSRTGAILAIGTATPLLVGLVSGALVDRWDRKRTMIVADSVRAGLALSIALALLVDAMSVGHLLVAIIGEEIFGTIFIIAGAAALANVVSPERLPDAMGQRQAATSGVRVVGSSLGGILYGISRSVPFVVNGASFLLSAAALGGVRMRFQSAQRASRRSVLADVTEGIRFLLDQPLLRDLTLVAAADRLRYAGGYLVIVLLAQNLGASPGAIGMVFSAAAIGAVAGSVVAGRVQSRFSVSRITVMMLWLNAFMFPLYALAPSVIWLGVVAAAESIVIPVHGVALGSFRLKATPDRLRGRVTSAVETIMGIARPLGVFVAGLLLAQIGARPTTFLLTAWLVLIATVTTVNPHVRKNNARGL